jgi:hypothetical protein
MGDTKGTYRVLWGNFREGYHLKDPGIDGSMILKGIFDKWVEGHGLNRSGSGYGQVAGCCECGNEPLASVKCGEFSD